MRYLTLPNTDIRTSALGFGCASIMGRQGKRKSLNALACAYDNGIIHFDVARSYGFGEAEKLVGKFIRNKRESICLATKFGILPDITNPLLQIAKPIARTLIDIVPSFRNRIKKSSKNLLNSGNFSVKTASNSLHESLSALGVETIDLFLLHDCNAATPLTDELFDFLDRCITAGKIRYYGLATDSFSARNLVKLHTTKNITLTQTPLSPIAEYAQLVNETHIKAHIVHSVITLKPMIKCLMSSNDTRSAHSDLLTRLDSTELLSILLKYASSKTQGGVTLMSSFNTQHIIRNTQSMETDLSEDMENALDEILISHIF